ncbi:hypothetical protein V2J09_016790 [Rumex salicifolius]
MSSASSSDVDSSSTGDNASIGLKTPRYKRRKVAIFFAYCGVGYQGMQRNPGAKTIEGDFEQALYLAGAVPEQFRGQPKRWYFARSARTDKGVSAVGQVVSGRFYVDPPGFVERLNANLPDQIRIFGYKRGTRAFNAKKLCDRRRYIYLLPVFALDPSCHRDRESVMSSLGSGRELVKCLECSERGRKVAGVMGKREFRYKVGDGKIADDLLVADFDSVGLSGISPNREAAYPSGQNVAVDSECLVQSDISSNREAASKDEGSSISNLDSVSVGRKITGYRLKENDVYIAEENEIKRSEFGYGEKEKEKFNRILKHYEGTRNFHNFTTRIKPQDPAAQRYIISITANTTITIEGIEFVRCEVLGQSFMLHQIRKMIGLAVAVMRGCAPESLLDTAFEQEVSINVPTAPEVGWMDSHEEMSMKAYAEEAEEFKLKYIHPHIGTSEHKEGSVGLWLHSLNHRNYPDLRGHDDLKN